MTPSTLTVSAANYPRIKKLPNGQYILFWHNNSVGANVFYTRSSDLKNWEPVKKVFEATPITVNGQSDERSYSNADALVLQNGELMVVASFRGQLGDVFTLAHEAGHCLHTQYSNTQPYVNKDYPIFLAEIASTVNENILMRGLISRCDASTEEGRREKAFLINRYLEEFRVVRRRVSANAARSSSSNCAILDLWALLMI